jgi:hypothetical protein
MTINCRAVAMYYVMLHAFVDLTAPGSTTTLLYKHLLRTTTNQLTPAFLHSTSIDPAYLAN